MNGYIDLEKLNLDELMGVVNLYPWFGGAKKELCLRLSKMGRGAWSESQFADAAMYLPSRRKLSDIIRAAEDKDLSDSDVEEIIKSYIVEQQHEDTPIIEKGTRKAYAGVGDYFSQDDYEQVRRSDDNVFLKYAAKARKTKDKSEISEIEFDLYTETLAQIYAEQGYYEHAKEIYSKLILAYPEKNTYFAALIDNLNELN